MLEAGALTNPETDARDWRLSLFAKITEWMQEYDNVVYLPVIA